MQSVRAIQRQNTAAGTLYRSKRRAAINRIQYSQPPSLRNLPFASMLNAYMGYSLVRNELTKAVEYSNIMQSAHSILRVADTDLQTFETRFDNMVRHVRKIGIDTKFTAVEIAGAVKYLSMAGMNIETINKSIRPITNLALIGDNDVSYIADLATNIMAGYDINNNSMDSVADIIASTISRSNVNIVEVAESYKMAAGFLKYDANDESAMPAIAVGRPYSSSKAQPVFPEDDSTGPYKIYFNEHVAQSSLKIVKTDPKFLAVTGKAMGIDEKFFEVTIRLNPEYDPATPGSKQYQTVNATQISKKSHKVTGNTTATGADTKSKVDLSTYTVVPYMSPHIGISSDELVEETTEYFRNYNLNGITGNLTIFGDFGLPPAVQVELIDHRNPSKNGVYLVEEVTTTFGVGGYRQQLSIPYKIRT